MAERETWVDRAWDFAASLARQGAKDLHNNIIPAFPSYAHGVDEPGTPLNPQPPDQPTTFRAAVERQKEAAATPSPEQDKGIEL